MSESRNYFRIEYPKNERPTLIHKDASHHVINISETGVLFTIDDAFLSEGDSFHGIIIFQDKERAEISGKIIRKQDDRAAILLKNRISLQKIMNEQRFLIKKYGTLKQPEVY